MLDQLMSRRADQLQEQVRSSGSSPTTSQLRGVLLAVPDHIPWLDGVSEPPQYLNLVLHLSHLRAHFFSPPCRWTN